MSLVDDSSTSEINILPDGRVCLFGASQQVLEMLDVVLNGDPTLRDRVDRLRKADDEHVAKVCNTRTDGTEKTE